MRVATIEEGAQREVWVRHRSCVIEAVDLRQADWRVFLGNNSPRFIKKGGTWPERQGETQGPDHIEPIAVVGDKPGLVTNSQQISIERSKNGFHGL